MTDKLQDKKIKERRVTGDMTFESLERIEVIAEAGPYLIGGDGQYYEMVRSLPLSEGTVLGWNAESMMEGAEYLIRRAEKGQYLYRVYPKKDWKETPEKRDVNVIHFPAEDKEEAKKKPYLMVCPGGAYVNVCALSEGYPIAKQFNQLGYDVFVVNYRVRNFDVMPKPLEDLAACVGYVRENAEAFDLGRKDSYIVCGFSAGGNLCALWGTKHLGYAHYDLPRPKALFPVYPVTDLHLFDGIPQETIDMFLATMLGEDVSEERKQEYSVIGHIDGDYPPCYIACCRDDETVPCVNSEKMYETLQRNRIPSVLEMGEHGGHGFGDGRFADTNGWMERAAAFAEGLEE